MRIKIKVLLVLSGPSRRAPLCRAVLWLTLIKIDAANLNRQIAVYFQNHFLLDSNESDTLSLLFKERQHRLESRYVVLFNDVGALYIKQGIVRFGDKALAHRG